MTENFVRHFVSFFGVVILFLVWFAGYKSGGYGWWWTGFGCLLFYGIIYTLLEV